MQVSAMGIKLVMQAEGFRPRVYTDIAGFPSIGYGHRILHPDSFKNGVDQDLAHHMLSCDLDDAEAAVARLVKVPLHQGQFDALVDFTFNLGATRLEESTLLTDLNAGKYDEAAEQLLRWDHSGLKEIPGLKSRREAEYMLWHFDPPNDPAQAQEVAA